MANESFAFLALYMEDAEDMTAEERGEYLEAVINYGLYGTEAEHESAAVRIAFRHAKKLIDGANAKKEANKENGAKGGRPKTEAKPNHNPTITQQKPNHNPSETIKVSINDNISVSDNINNNNNINNNTLSLSPTSPSQRIIAGGKARERERDKSDFDLFWDAYPRKDGLSAASDAWISAVEAGDIKYGDGAMIAEAVERAKTSRQWTQDGGRYIPMPARYIAERRWTDQGTTLPDTAKESSFDTSAFFAAAVEASEAQMKAMAGGGG